jgi:hypothetical protein
MGANQEILEKTLATSDMLSGTMNADQQRQFLTFVREASPFLSAVRVEQMNAKDQEFDKLHVGEPITRPDAENTNTAVNAKPKFNKVSLTTTKVRSDWNVSTEVLQQNIAENRLEEILVRTFSTRMASDMENLALNGDTNEAGGTPESLLLSTLDGYKKILEANAIVVDAGGSEISRSLLRKAKRALPKQFRNQVNLRWLASDSLADDWSDVVGARETVLGDRAFAGSESKVGAELAPLGVPWFRTPWIREDLSVTDAAATAGRQINNRYGPFEIATGTNNTLTLNIDAAGNVNVVLPAGVLETSVVVAAINGVIGAAGVASQTPDGHIVIQSATTGASSTVEVVASNAAATLGFTVGTNTGATAGNGSIDEGTYMILTNPKNMIWGIKDGTRMVTTYNPDYDRIETIVRNQVGLAIENYEACVLVKNVRLKAL